MRIGIFGSGGVGGYFGGLLAQSGHDVTFIARGEHLTALKSHGLQVKSVNGDFNVHPVQTTDDPDAVDELDYVIVGVKHYQLTDSIQSLMSFVSPQTTVVPLLNGIDAHDHLIDAFGPEGVICGLCSIVSMIEAPGVIRQESLLRRIVLGELDNSKTERVEKLVQAWIECGVEAIHSEDIFASIWTKFLFIASFSGITSLARTNVGEMLGCTQTRQLFIEAMKEVESLARLAQINLGLQVVNKALALTESFEPTTTSSMQRDVVAGKLFELEAFSGKIVRLGQEKGVPTPVHKTIYALLRPTLDRALEKT